MTSDQPRDPAGQFAPAGRTAPEVALSTAPDSDGLRGTIEDLLTNSLESYGFQVGEDDVEFAVQKLIFELESAHQG